MRKIISILVAVGLVLAMSVMAAPTAAQTCTATVTATSYCAGSAADYTIDFSITASMDQGVDSFVVEFGAGTGFPTWADGYIKVDGNDVAAADISVVGTTVTFLTPIDLAGSTMVPNPTTLWFKDIVNPALDGTYTLTIEWILGCCTPPAYIDCGEYTIVPDTSTYKLVVDFGPTYTGIAVDFVPPFKACGQENYGTENVTTGFWFTDFTFSIETLVEGCNVPCTDAVLYMIPTLIPEDETVSMWFDGSWYSLTDADITDPATPITLVDPVVMDVTMPPPSPYNVSLHFDSPGDYEICFYLECPAGSPSCATGCDPAAFLIAERCIQFTVHQWKDAYSFPLYRKWNLISLPLVTFETDIDAIFAAYPGAADILSIWHYDRCEDAWYTYPGLGLTDMYDGKAYWVYIDYDFHTNLPGDLHGTLWVWGHEDPMPPLAPSAYEVCTGWNMVGFRSVVNINNDVYLWNFVHAGPLYDYGLIYEWTATTQTWLSTAPGANAMNPAEGYWIPFSVDGYIYP